VYYDAVDGNVYLTDWAAAAQEQAAIDAEIAAEAAENSTSDNAE